MVSSTFRCFCSSLIVDSQILPPHSYSFINTNNKLDGLICFIYFLFGGHRGNQIGKPASDGPGTFSFAATVAALLSFSLFFTPIIVIAQVLSPSLLSLLNNKNTKLGLIPNL